MMTFVNHNIIKIIRCKILFIQIFRLAKRLHRSKNHRLINTFIRSPEKAIILGTTDITKRSRRLIQNLLAMRNKQNPCICFRIKSRNACLSYACRCLHQSAFCPFRTRRIQCTKHLNLCTARLIKHPHIRIRLIILVILIQILRHRRAMPILRIAFQFLLIDHNRMMLKQILKRLIEFTITLQIRLTVKPIIPLNTGSQRTPRHIGRTDIHLTIIIIMKHVCLGME